MSQSCWASIDLLALQHNFQQVRHYAPNRKILAMIKGNAYGHGLVRIASALSDADAFGLARFAEAMKLRQAGVHKRLVMLEGFTNSEQLSLVDQHELELVIHDLGQVQLILDYPWSLPLKLWLKIDTGMGRLGMKPDEASYAWQLINQYPEKISPQVCMTHFSQAQQLDDPKTSNQLAVFDTLCKTWPIAKSLANSAGILAWPDTLKDWVRPGIMLYGVSPFEDQTGAAIGLKPVMSLQTILIAIKPMQAGDTIGYDSTYICPCDMRLGVAAVGYADGYPRYIQPGTPVLVDGIQTTILGRVSMDMICINLTDIKVDIGATVTLWGNDLPIEVIAKCADSSPYELLSGITERVLYRG